MAESENYGTVHVSATVDAINLSVDTKAFWIDLADRASKTFLQNVLLFLGAGATLVSVSWPVALSSAGLATVVTVLLAFVGSTALTSGNFLIDLGDRAARTFAGSLVAAIPATGGFADVNWGDAVTIAGTAVVFSILTSLATVNLGASKGLPSTAPVTPVIDLEPESVTDTEKYVDDAEFRTGNTAGPFDDQDSYDDRRGRHAGN